jgi:hypothetical protein
VLGKLAESIKIWWSSTTRRTTPTGNAPSEGEQEAGRAELGLDLDEATRWIEGLDRIHKTRRIQRCFDLTATPFAPTGKSQYRKGLFEWIVSDFGLNDAIEAGLVKTPRVVVRDDALANAKTLCAPSSTTCTGSRRSGEDLNRGRPMSRCRSWSKRPMRCSPTTGGRMPERLGAEPGITIPPVMLTVCNRTETAARIEHYFNGGRCLLIPETAGRRTARCGWTRGCWRRPSAARRPARTRTTRRLAKPSSRPPVIPRRRKAELLED